MHRYFKDLTYSEIQVFRKLNTPKKIQDFIEGVPVNFEYEGDTLLSPRRVLNEQKAHCFEGALFAAAVLWYHKIPPIIMDLQPGPKDDGHVVALYKVDGLWGAISKTNHAVLRFRDPVYKTPREIAMSYFHEYFLDSGIKTLRTYTVLDLRCIKINWITEEKDLWVIDKALDHATYLPLLSKKSARNLRSADPVEIEAGKLVVWKRKKKN